MKKGLIIFICIIVSSLIANGSLLALDKYKFRVGSVNYGKHHVSQGVSKWAEIANEKSGGKITILHFPASQLGSGKEMFEACRAGFLDFAADSFANIVTLSRAFEVFHLPYMFESREQGLKALDSPEVKNMVDKILAEVNLKWIQSFDYGFRKIATTLLMSKFVTQISLKV
jgi:TRAP-type C4-dicarboxylate transport system substrate-binding protein